MVIIPPAARVGDLTSHGTALGPGPGSSNVLIEGKPAWRAGSDFHACSQVDPPSQAHVGGTVAMGSTTVLINGLPAARMGDSIVESGGPPNSIALGSMKVLIGP